MPLPPPAEVVKQPWEISDFLEQAAYNEKKLLSKEVTARDLKGIMQKPLPDQATESVNLAVMQKAIPVEGGSIAAVGGAISFLGAGAKAVRNNPLDTELPDFHFNGRYGDFPVAFANSFPSTPELKWFVCFSREGGDDRNCNITIDCRVTLRDVLKTLATSYHVNWTAVIETNALDPTVAASVTVLFRSAPTFDLSEKGKQ